jgi:hypothetical protein
MNPHLTDHLAQAHTADLIREAERQRLADARSAGRADRERRFVAFSAAFRVAAPGALLRPAHSRRLLARLANPARLSRVTPMHG